MKNPLIIIMTFVLLGLSQLFAQSPQAFKYQAVVRNASNAPMASQNVSLRLSVLESSTSGTMVYQETHDLTTTDLGLIALNVGEGMVVSGTFAAIDWGSDAYFLQVEVDEMGGTNYQLLGTSQLLAVPYSLYANEAGSVKGGTDPDTTNELQTLSISGNDLTISKGNTIALPSQTFTAGNGISITGGVIENTGDTNASDDITTATTALGDISGTFPNLTVTGFRGRPLSSTGPTVGDVLKWNGSLWIPSASTSNVLVDSDGDTKIQVERGVDDDTIRFDISGTEKIRMATNVGGNVQIEVLGNKGNLFIGSQAGEATNSSFFGGNTFIGFEAGKENNTGSSNTFLGEGAGTNNTRGFENTFIGTDAGHENNTGSRNTFVGHNAGSRLDSGGSNVFIGEGAGFFKPFGSRNVFIGQFAGGTNDSGSQNIFIGDRAGLFEDGSNKLWIGDLIYGEFDNDIMRVHGFSHVRNNGMTFEIKPGILDGVANTDWTTLEMGGDKNLRVRDNFSVLDNISVGSTDFPSDARLFVNGNIRIANDADLLGLDILQGYNDLRLQGDPNGSVDIQIQGDGRIGYGAGNTIGNLTHYFKPRNGSDYIFWIDKFDGTDVMNIDHDGNIGIGAFFNNVRLEIKAQSSDDWILVADRSNGSSALEVLENGNVNVTGNLSKGGGSFKIDHPLDPENKYLYHSFVESPDMMNVYNGNIVTDAQGFATVDLPDYFMALNRDYRYQLTVIGSFAQAIIKEKVSNNRFVIQTNQPNVEVSWQVTGIRQDKFAEANRIPNTVEKAPEDKGYYLHPEVFGKPDTHQVGRAQRMRTINQNVNTNE